MLSTPIILSDAVGVSTLFDRDSSFMFETGDALSLAEQMRSAFMQRDTISQMGAAARRVFEKELSLEIFAERFCCADGGASRNRANCIPKTGRGLIVGFTRSIGCGVCRTRKRSCEHCRGGWLRIVRNSASNPSPVAPKPTMIAAAEGCAPIKSR